MKKVSFTWTSLAGLAALLCSGCGSTNNATFGPSVYVLNVTSVNPVSAVQIGINPVDNNGAGSSGSTALTSLNLVYNKGTSVTLTAPASQSQGKFLAWTGCDSTSGLTCTVAMNASRSVQAQYPGVSSLVLSPINPTAGLPSTLQFTTTVNGLGTCTEPPAPGSPSGTPSTQVDCSQTGYTYSLVGTTYPAGFDTNSPNPGTISPQTNFGSAPSIYTAPFGAPATVTVTVTSLINPSINAQTTVSFAPTIPTSGPTLSVDLGAPTYPISPYIYGMNDYKIPASLPGLVDLPIERWGGDMTTRYNYTNDSYNSASDFFFENSLLGTGSQDTSTFNTQIESDKATNTLAIASVPLIGYTTLRKAACSYSVAKYGAQTVVDPNNTDCGTGTLSSTNKPVANDPTDTSYVIDQTFDSGWVSYLAGKFGTAANGGVAMYELDNEPEYWDGVHTDVHPTYLSYDELTNKGLTYAAAIKAQDPTALVTGPTISNWDKYFISQLDQFQGYTKSPYCQYDNETDYAAHGSVPLIEYYLQQFAAKEKSGGTRLLDYLDMHTYFAAQGAAFSTAGGAGLQFSRLDSTRVFWDPTYVDPNGNYVNVIPNPGAKYDPCSAPTPVAPMLIRRAKGWVKNDYPGTKVAFTEYNWGGLESMNGALAQADILGIFGREGLDMAMLWAPPDPTTQFPGVAAFQMYTNYDGKNSKFGDMGLTSLSTLASGADGESYLSVYGAQRTSDKAITVMVLNKGQADQMATLSLLNTNASGNAASYQFLSTNLKAIVPGPAVAITAPAAGSTTSTISTTFPAQSITLLVIPQ